MIDLSYLKKDDIFNDRIIYKRHKTGKRISFLLQDHAKEIIQIKENNIIELNEAWKQTIEEQSQFSKTYKKEQKKSKEQIDKKEASILRLNNELKKQEEKFLYRKENLLNENLKLQDGIKLVTIDLKEKVEIINSLNDRLAKMEDTLTLKENEFLCIKEKLTQNFLNASKMSNNRMLEIYRLESITWWQKLFGKK